MISKAIDDVFPATVSILAHPVKKIGDHTILSTRQVNQNGTHDEQGEQDYVFLKSGRGDLFF